MGTANDALLKVMDLKKYFPTTKGLLKRVVGYVRAVDGINFYIRRGETLGLVGESGCGKTTTGRLILRLMEPTEGKVYFRTNGNEMIDLASLNEKELKKFRPKMQPIFQDPYSSLSPRMKVKDIVSEPLVASKKVKRKTREDIVRLLLEKVGLKAEHMERYPHEFSGGQRQRIGIARALILNPELVIADEPVSALDVSVQAEVLNLIRDLQEEFNLTYLFIAHDLNIVEYMSDRIAVMYLGKIVEMGSSRDIYHNPKHPYTEALISATPFPDPEHKTDIMLKGDISDSVNLLSGCNFYSRCRYVKGICAQEEPMLKNIAGKGEEEHYVACHYCYELNLKGIREF